MNSARDPLEKQKKANACSQKKKKKRKCQNANVGSVLAVHKRVLHMICYQKTR